MPRGAPDWFYGAPQKTVEQLLREGNGFGGAAVQPAVAGQYSKIQLFNHTGSGVEALIYRADFKPTGNTTVNLSFTLSQYATAVTKGWCRRIDKPQSQLWLRRAAEAGAAPLVYAQQYVAANQVGHIFPVYLWLPPLYAVTVNCETANIGLTAVLWWFEFVEY